MQTSRRLLVAWSVLGALGAMSAHCSSTECDQFTDCLEGYTCASGKCVAPASPMDASADASADSRADGGLVRDSASVLDGGARDVADARETAATVVDASHDGSRDAVSQDAPRDVTSVDTSSPDVTAPDVTTLDDVFALD